MQYMPVISRHVCMTTRRLFAGALCASGSRQRARRGALPQLRLPARWPRASPLRRVTPWRCAAAACMQEKRGHLCPEPKAEPNAAVKLVMCWLSRSDSFFSVLQALEATLPATVEDLLAGAAAHAEAGPDYAFATRQLLHTAARCTVSPSF